MTPLEEYFGPNAGYVADLFDRYQDDPGSVDAETRAAFDAWLAGPASSAASAPPAANVLDVSAAAGAAALAQAIRLFGHLAANIDPLEEITEEVDAAIRQLNSILPKPGEVIKDKATADKIANSKDRLRELWRKADGQRVAEKKPHDEAVAAVQARWKPLVEAKVGRIAQAGEKAEAALAAHLKWARAEQDRIEREREAACREEERLRQEEHARAVAEAAAKAEPEPEPPPPVEAPPPPEPARVGGGLSGRRRSQSQGDGGRKRVHQASAIARGCCGYQGVRTRNAVSGPADANCAGA